jgi:hypothetical protein
MLNGLCTATSFKDARRFKIQKRVLKTIMFHVLGEGWVLLCFTFELRFRVFCCLLLITKKYHFSVHFRSLKSWAAFLEVSWSFWRSNLETKEPTAVLATELNQPLSIYLSVSFWTFSLLEMSWRIVVKYFFMALSQV